MTFDEWWYKYGVEIDIPKNEACVIWMAALNNAEALKPSHNSSSPKLPCPHLDNVGGCIKTVGHKKCTCGYVNRQLRAS